MNIEDSAAILTVPLYLLESTLVLLVILLTLKLKNNWLIFGLLLTFFSLPYFLSCPLLSPFSKTSKSSFLVWKLVLVLNFFNSFLHFEQDILLVKKHNRQLLCLYLIFNFTKPLKEPSITFLKLLYWFEFFRIFSRNLILSKADLQGTYEINFNMIYSLSSVKRIFGNFTPDFITW